MIVKLIKKEAERWAGVKFYKGCGESIGSYYTRSGRRYTGLEPEDAERYCKLLGYKEGHLSPDSTFWDNFGIKMTGDKEFILLNTDDPYQEFHYKFLKGHKDVAFSLKDITPGKKWLLLHDELEANESNKNARLKRKAFQEFDKMTPDEMRKALRLYGINATNSNTEIVESTLFRIVEESPIKFIQIWVDNINKEVMFLIEEAVSKNVLRKANTTYKYGTDVLGYTIEETIEYLKNPAHRDLRITILSQIEGKSEFEKSKNKTTTLKSQAEKLLEEITKDTSKEVISND
jgi:hypothetical protein